MKTSQEKALKGKSSKFDKHITKHFANNPDVRKDSDAHAAHQEKVFGKGGMSAYLKKNKVV